MSSTATTTFRLAELEVMHLVDQAVLRGDISAAQRYVSRAEWRSAYAKVARMRERAATRAPSTTKRLAFTVPGRPQPKQRPRRGRNGRWYTPSKTGRYEHRVGWIARAALREAGLRWPMNGEYLLRVKLWFGDRRRRDADNVVKSIQDGLTKILWEDDHRVGIECPPWEVDREDPRAEIEVEVIG